MDQHYFYICTFDDERRTKVLCTDAPPDEYERELKHELGENATITALPFDPDHLVRTVDWHGKAPTADQLEQVFCGLMMIDAATEEGSPLASLLEGLAALFFDLGRRAAQQQG